MRFIIVILFFNNMTSIIPPPAPPDRTPGFRLPRNVLVLGGISLLNDTASEMIYPLLPIFLTQTLGASAASLGLIEGVAESAVSLFKLFSGYLSDRLHRRKIWIGVGYAVSNAVRPLIALAGSWPAVLALRFADRIGKGLRTSPRDALVAESVPPQHRGRAFGFHRAMDHLGAVIGPLLAALILWRLPDRLRLIFFLSAIPGALVVLLVARGLREIPGTVRDSRVFQPLEAWRAVPTGFKRYLGVLLLFNLGNASDAFLLLKARQLGLPVLALPLLWSFHHVVKSATSVPSGLWSDRWGRKRLLIAGWGIYAAVYGLFAVARGDWAPWALMGVYGVFFGLTEGVERALMADLAPAALRGSVFGLYHLTVGFGSLLASVAFGLVWKWRGDAAAFRLGAFMALSAAVALAFLKLPSGGEPQTGVRRPGL